ncbi:MAG: RNA-binding S4 domain-containing protein [Sphingomonadaceae bacterium]
MAAGAMRIDRLLYYLRFARSRSLAHAMVDQGHIRRNGERVLRASQSVMAGDVLTMPLGKGVIVMELLALPLRRGPASEAQSCYRVLDAGGQSAIATPKTNTEGHALP